jgi:hypothetical protein
MFHATLNGPRREEALSTLDHLMADIALFHDDPNNLLQEHLRSARVCLLGAMPDEYECSLVAARKSASGLTDPTEQNRVRREVDALLQDAKETAAPGNARHQHHRPPHSTTVDDTKSELYRFFQGSGTTFGVFYPTHYIFAAFRSYQAARNAADKLEEVGFDKDELVAVTPAETVRFFKEVRADVGLWGELMSRISRFFGTEEVFADMDIRRSRDGAGFLAVYCPRETEAERIRDLIEPLEPLSMQLYLPSGIRSLSAP